MDSHDGKYWLKRLASATTTEDFAKIRTDLLAEREGLDREIEKLNREMRSQKVVPLIAGLRPDIAELPRWAQEYIQKLEADTDAIVRARGSLGGKKGG
jgi:hypothetical protein